MRYTQRLWRLSEPIRLSEPRRLSKAIRLSEPRRLSEPIRLSEPRRPSEPRRLSDREGHTNVQTSNFANIEENSPSWRRAES